MLLIYLRLSVSGTGAGYYINAFRTLRERHGGEDKLMPYGGKEKENEYYNTINRWGFNDRSWTLATYKKSFCQKEG